MKKKALCLMLGLALFLSACRDGDSKESTQPEAMPTKVAQAQETPAGVPAEAATTPSLESDALAIGDSAVLGDWDIVVSDFYFTDKVENGEFFYYSPEEGSLYAVVSAQVTNNGKESGTFLPSFSTNSDVRADIYYAGEYEYSASLLLMDEDLHNSILNPLTSKSGIIVFELPEMIKESEETLALTFSAGKDKVTISLR